jgi:hypothetical protein
MLPDELLGFMILSLWLAAKQIALVWADIPTFCTTRLQVAGSSEMGVRRTWELQTQLGDLLEWGAIRAGA